MMRKELILQLFFRFLVNVLGIWLAAVLFKHVSIDSFWALFITAFALMASNMFVKPIIMFLSIPFIIATLGLFYLVINGLVVLFVSWVVSSFYVDGLWTAIGVSIVVSVVNFVFDMFYINKNKYIVEGK